MLRSPVMGNMPVAVVIEEIKTRRWLWCLLAVVVVAMRHFLTEGAPPLGDKFGDTDDALRLYQVREFLMHGGWYDTQLDRIGAPEALNSHWSRLIDLPVAWLISVFALFTPYLTAEKLAMIVWPLLLLFALARFFIYEAERRLPGEAGTRAGVISLVLLLLCATGLFQFMPGRIDHHNAQILFAVTGILLMRQAITAPEQGWLAGALLGTGIVIGLEALPLLAACVGVAGLIACFDATARTGVVRVMLALFASLLAGFAITTHPSAWATVNCDALSLNLLALVGSGALTAGLLAARYRAAPYWVWIAGFGVSGVIGIALYIAANPVCANGAFTGMDQVVKDLWLARVREGQSLLQFIAIKPGMGIAYLITMAMALAIVIRTASLSRNSTNIFEATCLVLATLYGLYYMKFTPYGPMLSLVPVACWIARLKPWGETSAESMRLRAIIVLNQTLYVFVISGLIGFYSSASGSKTAEAQGTVSSCSYRSDIAALSKLPPGLIVANIDFGPYIAVATHHRAYAGPYHRIHGSIRDTILILRADPNKVAPRLAASNADYLVLCGKSGEAAAAGTSKKPGDATFSDLLLSGEKFPGLEPVSIGETKGPLKVWKIVKPQK